MHTMNIVKNVTQFTNMTENEFETWCNERGPHLYVSEQDILFEDCARISNANTDYKEFIDPPEDRYVLAMAQSLYWKKVSDNDAQKFNECKSYFLGNGFRPEEVLELCTEDEQIEYLEQLLKTAQRSRSKLRRCLRDMEKHRPEEDKLSEQSEIENEKRKHEFEQRLDKYEL